MGYYKNQIEIKKRFILACAKKGLAKKEVIGLLFARFGTGKKTASEHVEALIDCDYIQYDDNTGKLKHREMQE